MEIQEGDVVFYRQHECEVIVVYTQNGHPGDYLLIQCIKFRWRMWRVHKDNVMWLRRAALAQQ